MKAARVDFEIDQGSTFEKVFTLTDNTGSPFSLVGYTLELKAVKQLGDASAIIDSASNLTIAYSAPLTLGYFTISMTDEQTAALDFNIIEYRIEAEFTGGARYRWYEGYMTLNKEIVI